MDMAPDKRERILGAAARLIVRNGLQCSMAAIADEAGVATGSLYNYFENKEELVLGVYRHVSEQMAARLTASAEPGLSAEGQLRLYIERYIDFIWEDAARARLFDYLDNNPVIGMEGAITVFGPLVRHGVALISAAQGEGAVRPGPPTVMMSFVRGAIRNTLKRLRAAETVLTPETRQLVATMCWDAVATTRPAAGI